MTSLLLPWPKPHIKCTIYHLHTFLPSFHSFPLLVFLSPPLLQICTHMMKAKNIKAFTGWFSGASHHFVEVGQVYQLCFSFSSEFGILKMTPRPHIPYFGFVDRRVGALQDSGTLNTFQCRTYQWQCPRNGGRGNPTVLQITSAFLKAITLYKRLFYILFFSYPGQEWTSQSSGIWSVLLMTRPE